MGTRHQEKDESVVEAKFHSSPQQLSVSQLRHSLGLTRKTFSRLTGYSERAIAEWEAGKVQSDASRQRLIEIHRLQQSLIQVLPEGSVGPWLLAPNDALDGFKPLELIERGEIDRIWRMLYRHESNKK